MIKYFLEIKTQRLALREIKLKDTKQIFTLFSCPETIKYTDNKLLTTLEDAQKLIVKYKQEFKDHKSIRWAVLHQKKSEIIGLVSLYHIDKTHQFASIGSLLKPAYRRKGIITEAQRAVFRYAFTQLNLNRLEGQMFVGNTASIAKNEKLGFVREGRLRQNFMINNKLEDAYIYSLLKEDFFS